MGLWFWLLLGLAGLLIAFAIFGVCAACKLRSKHARVKSLAFMCAASRRPTARRRAC